MFGILALLCGIAGYKVVSVTDLSVVTFGAVVKSVICLGFGWNQSVPLEGKVWESRDNFRYLSRQS